MIRNINDPIAKQKCYEEFFRLYDIYIKVEKNSRQACIKLASVMSEYAKKPEINYVRWQKVKSETLENLIIKRKKIILKE